MTTIAWINGIHMSLNNSQLAAKLERHVKGVVHTEAGGRRLSLSLAQAEELLSAAISEEARFRTALASFPPYQRATIVESLRLRAIDPQPDDDGAEDASALYSLATGRDPHDQ